MIIFLNGVSSSGKSSIARSLQDAWRTPILHIGVDRFIDLMPARFCGDGEAAHYGLQFVLTDTQAGPVVEIHQGAYAKKLFLGMVGGIGALARAETDMSVDDVLFGDTLLREYIRELSGQIVYFVAVHCPLEVIECRERERGDRFINSAKAQFPLVHGPTRSYDLELDTSVYTPDQLAALIMQYIETTPEPQGFAAMARGFGIS